MGLCGCRRGCGIVCCQLRIGASEQVGLGEGCGMRAACGTRCFSACVVRALLCTSTPVESYAIITRFSLALTIQTTRLLLTADKPLLENRAGRRTLGGEVYHFTLRALQGLHVPLALLWCRTKPVGAEHAGTGRLTHQQPFLLRFLGSAAPGFLGRGMLEDYESASIGMPLQRYKPGQGCTSRRGSPGWSVPEVDKMPS